MEKKYKVYKHTSPDGKIYIGITSQENVEDRWKGGNGYHHNRYFYNSIKKYGWNNFRHEILDTDIDKHEAETKERQYIAEYRSNNPLNGYNLTDGGEIGKQHSAASKLLMSQKKKQQSADPEYRKKLSESHKGITPYNKGMPMSEEQKKKISEVKKGCPGPLPKKVLCIEKNIVYSSMTEAAQLTGAQQTKISDVCRGKRHTAGGFHWKIVEETK